MNAGLRGAAEASSVYTESLSQIRMEPYTSLIRAVTTEPTTTWEVIGYTRDHAEHNYSTALASGLAKPVYRIVVTRRVGKNDR